MYIPGLDGWDADAVSISSTPTPDVDAALGYLFEKSARNDHQPPHHAYNAHCTNNEQLSATPMAPHSSSLVSTCAREVTRCKYGSLTCAQKLYVGRTDPHSSGGKSVASRPTDCKRASLTEEGKRPPQTQQRYRCSLDISTCGCAM